MTDEAATVPDAIDRLKEIYEDVSQEIAGRTQYEERLRICWKVRHDGIARKKDVSWQSDTPLKIADPAIDKIKPQLVQGIFTADTLATFSSMDDEVDDETAKLAAQWFTYQVKHCSNFFKQFVIVTDMELQDGKALLKVIWNAEKNQVEFHAVPSMYLIVPSGTEELEDTDWACQIHRVSKAKFKRLAKAKGWTNVDDDFIKAAVGKGNREVGGQLKDDKRRKEGLHYGCSEDEIVYWEHYQRNEAGEWEVTYLVPNLSDKPLGDNTVFPYQHGKLPYVEFGAELKDKDYHSPRGVVEKIMPEERIATNYRNLISDHAAFSARPVFTTNGTPIGNTNNLVYKPGSMFPGIGLEAVKMPPAPEILGQEMNMARRQGEQLGGAGDYALQDSQQGGKNRTATEVGVVAQMTGAQMDLRARLNRDSLSLVFKQGWLLLVQYASDRLKYFFGDKMNTLPAEAMRDAYLIEPSGNPDGYSRQFQMQMAMTISGICKGDPKYDQDELGKYLLETADPSLVKRLFLGTKVAEARESEDQAHDILLLREGFPTTINPTEDHAARAIITAQYLQRAVLEHEQIQPRGMQMLQQHILQRIEALKQTNPKAVPQLMQALKQIEGATIEGVKQQQAADEARRAAMAQQPTPLPPGAMPPTPSALPAQPGAGGGPMVPPRIIPQAPAPQGAQLGVA